MLTLRTESIRLYRDILRGAQMFTWKNTDGRMWSEILAENARKEFEQARHERDPEMISRMLVVGRDALNQTMEKATDMSQKQPGQGSTSGSGNKWT